ncbi:MAG: insulinase family protein [Nitrospirales bacterium]|nr:insulinase family protein [Nitrospirales bacterium]
MYKKVVFDNGVRVVLEKMPSLRSVAVGVWVNVGTRDEQSGEEGLSHFLEHMLFKGTRRRTAAKISQEIDSLGGEMNAFTTHESTAFYVKVLDQHVPQAVDLLTDLFYHSRFDPKEIQKEKNVVLEEIRTVLDDPEDYVQELHARDVFRRHPLGRSILGKRKTMVSIKRADLLRYMEAQYHPEKTVIAVAGNFSVSEMLSSLQASFGEWTPRQRPAEEARKVRQAPNIYGGTFTHHKRLAQTHLCMGLKGLPAAHPDRYAMHVLNGILGGGVSSRLFQEVREKRGLVYTIFSHLSSFSDGGLLTVYAAMGSKEAQAVVDVVCKEIRRLKKRGVDCQELERTKNQLKGALMLGLEGTYGRMNKLAKDEISQGRYVSLREMLNQIDRVSADHVHSLSHELLDFDQMAITALGPLPRGTFGNEVERK